MPDKTAPVEKNKNAQKLVAKRWAKTTKEQRKAYSEMLNAARKKKVPQKA